MSTTEGIVQSDATDWSEHYRRAAAIDGNAIMLHHDSGHRHAGMICDVVRSDEMLAKLREISPNGEAFEYEGVLLFSCEADG